VDPTAGKQTRKLRVVPRVPGDTTPLDPAVAEALRKAGMDPAKFTLAPPGEPETWPQIPPAGTRVAHSFRFASLDGAFSAMERLLDDRISARIGKAADGWLVVFESAPGGDDAADQQRLTSVATSLGGEDRGSLKETINVNMRQVQR
jgi:hypothetical protein